MKKYTSILFETENDIVRIFLNRPERSNALNMIMIRELTELINSLNTNIHCRFIIISSKGNSFCSGADLKWMNDASKLTSSQNLSECLEMAHLYETIYNSRNITITLVSGTCIGGGIGLAAASDFCLASENASFQFGEVKIGLVPATISPFVVQRSGYQNTKILMLTGMRFNAQYASEVGLVDKVMDQNNEYEEIESLLEKLRSGGKEAIINSKKLLNRLGSVNIDVQLQHLTAEIIAAARVSDEGKEGIQAFLEKRNPNW
jgi:methylglutaconyl-CoA hydratase